MVLDRDILVVGLVAFSFLFLSACSQPVSGPQAKLKAELPVAATLQFE